MAFDGTAMMPSRRTVSSALIVFVSRAHFTLSKQAVRLLALPSFAAFDTRLTFTDRISKDKNGQTYMCEITRSEDDWEKERKLKTKERKISG